MASWKNMELSMKSKPSENKRQSETEMSQTQAMCSLLGVDHRRFLTNSNPYNISGTYEEDLEEWCSRIILIAHLVAYIAVLFLVAIILFMILKFLSDVNSSPGVTETDPIMPRKTMPLTYGTCPKDLESGSCSNSSSSSSSNYASEELYDGKICIICFDEQRNCFFVPCGHCATCYDCAKRIFDEETKTCPVCRRCIGKVRKLFAA
uniref:E3 ubiquitin-protein ligase NEURL1-like isoform X1 n=1 Tax=Ziziphus jujuba TaxID=326968 RepID=A0A6P4BQZ7_ZIZJJ